MGLGKSAFGSLACSVLLGTASGYLSQTGAATVLSVSPNRDLPNALRSPWVKRLSLASAGGEMVANAFITFLPSRKSAGPLVGRIAFGAGSAGLFASTRGRGVVLPMVAGGVSAAAASKAASDSRAVFARYVPDPLVGWAENAVAVGLAVAATKK